MTRQNKSGRVMAGQRAGVCGLVIAGMSLMAACKVMGVPYLAMKEMLPEGWHERRFRKAWRWIDDELKALHVYWHDRRYTTQQIAARFGVTSHAVCMVARKHGWPRRKRNRLTDGTPFKDLTDLQRRLFFKLRRGGIERDEAMRAAARMAA